MAWVEELPKVPLNTTAIKRLDRQAGTVLARRPYAKTHLRFTPTAYLFITGNDVLPVTAQDGGTWRRLRLVRFERHLAKRERDARVLAAVRRDPAVREAFAAELVRRCKALAATGWEVAEPECVERWTGEWRAEANPVLSWFHDRLEADPASPGVRTADVLADMQTWGADLDSDAPPLPRVNATSLKRVLGAAPLPVTFTTTRVRQYVALDGVEHYSDEVANPVQVWPGVRWRKRAESENRHSEAATP